VAGIPGLTVPVLTLQGRSDVRCADSARIMGSAISARGRAKSLPPHSIDSGDRDPRNDWEI
jgi:hypothetical protein